MNVAAMRRKQLTPEEKVNLAINMSDVAIQICADGIKDLNPDMTTAELKIELRKRLSYRRPQHPEV